MTVSGDKAAAGRLLPVLGLIAVTIGGFLLRLVEIDRWPLWGDEGLTLLLGQWSLRYLFLVPIDPTPGLYYALHKLLLGPMVDAAGARYISLACGTVLIPVAYLLAKEIRAPALLTAALVALSFPLIDYSQEARAYSLLVLLVTCSAAFFARWTRSGRQAHLLVALLFGVLSFYTHLVSIFWLGPMCLAIMWIARRQAVQPLLLFTLLAIPEIGRLLTYNPGNFSWLAQATPMQAADTLSRALLPFRPTGLWLAAPALLLAWRIWAHRRALAAWGRQNPGAAFTLAALVAFPILIWLFGFVVKPLFMTRTILAAVPGCLAALALLLKFEHRLVRWGVAGLYAGSLLVTGTTRDKDDWRAIAQRVGGDAILMCQPWQATAMRHALATENRMFLRYDNGLVEVAGKPWQTVYFKTLLTKDLMPEAQQRAAGASMALGPVWPVRSGQIEQMTAAPATLGQAIAFCDSVRAADRRQSYIAD